MRKTLIRNGTLVDPAAGRQGRLDLLIEEGRVSKVGEGIRTEADRVIDAAGKLVFPGLVDLHAHLRDPGFEHKETIASGTRAAARGGFTTICAMPNTSPAMDSGERIRAFVERARHEAAVRVVPIGAITRGQEGKEIAALEEMAAAGAMAFSEDGKSVMDTALYYEAMGRIRDLGLPIFAHCEDRGLAAGGVMNAGKRAGELGLKGIPNSAEDVIVARDILMARETGARLHLCHCSTEGSVALLRFAKGQGWRVTGEACPHHFALCDEDIEGDDANFKMNPPLRGRKDMLAVREALRDGVLDAIATDHAPHGREEKERSMRDAPFGVVGLETALALAMTDLLGNGYLTLPQLVERMSAAPARILGIDRGTLAEGKAADLILVDGTREWTVRPERFASKGRNTPFAGRKLTGKVVMTIVAGEVAWEEREDGPDA